MSIISMLLIGTGYISILTHRKNYILVLISLELVLIGITVLFLNSSIEQDDISGIMTGIYILVLAAAESAICLTLLIVYNRNNK